MDVEPDIAAHVYNLEESRQEDNEFEPNLCFRAYVRDKIQSHEHMKEIDLSCSWV